LGGLMRIIVGFFVAFAIARGMCLSSDGGTITGTVVGEESQTLNGTKVGSQKWQPIQGADVRLVNVFTGDILQTTQSAADGTFSFAAVAPGNYGIEAQTKQACVISDAFRVIPDSKTVLQLRLRNREVCSDAIRFASPRPQ
jgi:Carboxypeptidase regulatory-like domain